MKKFLTLPKIYPDEIPEEEITPYPKCKAHNTEYHFKIILLSTPITLCTKSDL